MKHGAVVRPGMHAVVVLLLFLRRASIFCNLDESEKNENPRRRMLLPYYSAAVVGEERTRERVSCYNWSGVGMRGGLAALLLKF